MAKAAIRGYLARPAKGVYEIIAKTADIEKLKGNRKLRNAPKGRGALKDPVAALEEIAVALVAAIQALKDQPKFDITNVPNKELYSEVARRNTK
jgi:hypothetical protein